MRLIEIRLYSTAVKSMKFLHQTYYTICLKQVACLYAVVDRSLKGDTFASVTTRAKQA